MESEPNVCSNEVIVDDNPCGGFGMLEEDDVQENVLVIDNIDVDENVVQVKHEVPLDQSEGVTVNKKPQANQALRRTVLNNPLIKSNQPVRVKPPTAQRPKVVVSQQVQIDNIDDEVTDSFEHSSLQIQAKPEAKFDKFNTVKAAHYLAEWCTTSIADYLKAQGHNVTQEELMEVLNKPTEKRITTIQVDNVKRMEKVAERKQKAMADPSKGQRGCRRRLTERSSRKGEQCDKKVLNLNEYDGNFCNYCIRNIKPENLLKELYRIRREDQQYAQQYEEQYEEQQYEEQYIPQNQVLHQYAPPMRSVPLPTAIRPAVSQISRVSNTNMQYRNQVHGQMQGQMQGQMYNPMQGQILRMPSNVRPVAPTQAQFPKRVSHVTF